jgi:hypothetical protein
MSMSARELLLGSVLNQVVKDVENGDLTALKGSGMNIQIVAENLRLFEIEKAQRLSNPWYRLRLKFYIFRKRFGLWIA